MPWSSMTAEVARRTPPDRDRVIDLLRVGSILVVVAGHWLLAVVTVQDGRIVGDNLLALVPSTQWLTWLFQVMPVFFLVGGAVNGRGWAAASRAGTPPAAWIERRALRLLRPVAPLLVVWSVLLVLLDAAGVGGDLLRLGGQFVLTPVWFLAVYLGVVALVPLTHALHRRSPLGTLAGFLLLAVGADIARRAGVAWVGWTSYLWVWGGVHQLGVVWGEHGTRWRPRSGLLVLVVCLGGLLVATGLLGYPRSMVGVPGAVATNNTPPTIALLLLAGVQFGGVVASRPALARWLQRPAAWTAVTLVGRRALTLFLWHQTALVAVVGATVATRVWPATERVDATWWATRPAWFAVLGGMLALLVVLMGRFEVGGPPQVTVRRGALLRVGTGVAATVTGLSWLTLVGPYDPSARMPLRVVPLALVAGGMLALGVVRRGGRRSPRTPGPASITALPPGPVPRPTADHRPDHAPTP
jgi:fucose 4-O-acetylase-like acetyltransferase